MSESTFEGSFREKCSFFESEAEECPSHTSALQLIENLAAGLCMVYTGSASGALGSVTHQLIFA